MQPEGAAVGEAVAKDQRGGEIQLEVAAIAGEPGPAERQRRGVARRAVQREAHAAAVDQRAQRHRGGRVQAGAADLRGGEIVERAGDRQVAATSE